MPPKHSTAGSRGRPSNSVRGASKSKASASNARASASSRAPQQLDSDDSDVDPFADSQPEQEQTELEEVQDLDEDEEPVTLPPELLTRMLHEFFEKDDTRISKDANKAVAKYMDVFVREAIARAAVEKESGFLEVEDLEKVAPQLLLDV
ncbi:CENP-S associating centromere protein X-domain-containing protein [Pseudomassariella vexata]|uniref:CENP-S associating centromere protein X-domain-containing protein n=1 Tax=Pseudomassariella vexata TaxID=1141098 RepID=A0A1Y2DYL9_9PEZI|nr:CENP-S associating centromere protein X-domain-containing protein [Pseudomassariella vexata]ORY64353.1 CENP-S associating centromere protein X-domain-containing protein [Pseudomassariella vexata]